MESKELMKPYEELMGKLETLRAGRESMVRKALEPIKESLDEIDALIAEAESELESVKNIIIGKVMEIGETIEGDVFMAVYNAPAVRWNTKLLEGYAIAHPEILAMRTVDEAPKVTFRKIARTKKKEAQ